MQSGHVLPAKIAPEGTATFLFDHNKAAEKWCDLLCLDQMGLLIARINGRWWRPNRPLQRGRAERSRPVDGFKERNEGKWSHRTPWRAHRTSPCSPSCCRTPCCCRYTRRSCSGTFWAPRTLSLFRKHSRNVPNLRFASVRGKRAFLKQNEVHYFKRRLEFVEIILNNAFCWFSLSYASLKLPNMTCLSFKHSAPLYMHVRALWPLGNTIKPTIQFQVHKWISNHLLDKSRCSAEGHSASLRFYLDCWPSTNTC